MKSEDMKGEVTDLDMAKRRLAKSLDVSILGIIYIPPLRLGALAFASTPRN
jgi:hypothetical protein